MSYFRFLECCYHWPDQLQVSRIHKVKSQGTFFNCYLRQHKSVQLWAETIYAIKESQMIYFYTLIYYLYVRLINVRSLNTFYHLKKIQK